MLEAGVWGPSAPTCFRFFLRMRSGERVGCECRNYFNDFDLEVRYGEGSFFEGVFLGLFQAEA